MIVVDIFSRKKFEKIYKFFLPSRKRKRGFYTMYNEKKANNFLFSNTVIAYKVKHNISKN